MTTAPSTSSIKTQVVIVGAGPTGLSMAAQLIRYNIDFIIIEKNPGTTPFSKALVVQARTLEIFQELELADKAIQTGKITTALNMFYKGKPRAKVNINNLGQGLSAYPYVLSLEQSKTEKLLAEYLAQHGKTIKWNTQLTHFEQNDNEVTVYFTDETGKEHKAEAAYLVGCDGAGSLMRHQLGLSFEGTTEAKLFYVADVILQSPVINKNELYINMIKKGFVLFFPMEGAGHYRIVGILPGVTDMEKQVAFSDVLPAIDELVYPVDIESLHWFSTYKVHSRKAASFMKGRCFVAGDAAHIHTPAGGQGMNTGIQDTYNLAWKIAYTLRGEVNNEVLNTYDTERTGNARHLLKTTDRMFDLFSGVNSFWNFLRLTFFPALLGWITKSDFVKRQIFPLLSQTGIAYPNSFLALKSAVGKVKAGDRMHYFIFSDGTQIFDYLREPVFKLLHFGSKQPDAFGEFNLKLTFQNFREIPKNIFGNEENFFILLRPDNHISYIGRDINICRSFLKGININ